MKTIIPFLILLFTSCSGFNHLPKLKFEKLNEKKDLSELEENIILFSQILEGRIKKCSSVEKLLASEDVYAKSLLRPYEISLCNWSDDKLHSFLTEKFDSLPYWQQREIILSLESDKYQKSVRRLINIKKLDFINFEKRKSIIQDILKFSVSPKEIMEAKSLIEKTSEDKVKVVTRFNIFSVAEELYRKREFEKAREYYDIVIEDKYFSMDEKVKAWNKKRFSYKQEREKRKYLKVTHDFFNYLKEHREYSLHYDIGIKLARIYWTIDEFNEALQVLEYLENNAPNEYKEMVYFYKAGIANDQKDRDQNLMYLNKAFNYSSVSSKLFEKIIWKLGWASYKEKDFKKAIEWFDKVDNNKSKFLFWKAVSYKKMNLDEEANKIFRELQEDDLSFYGQVSTIFTNETLPRMDLHKVEHVFMSQYRDFDWVVYLGRYDIAKEIINSKIINEEEHDELFKYYIAANDYKGSILSFYKLDKELKEDLLEEGAINYVYPLAYLEEFRKYNQSDVVPLEFLLSIARQESAFDRAARSPADAFGLLQVIPSQAKRLAKKYDINYHHFEDLYNPEIVIKIASRLQDELFKKFSGNKIDIIASYNAGENALIKWRNRIELEGLEFIEEIPYRETRKYVKLVSRNFFIYKRMIEGDYKIPHDFFR